MTRPLRWTAALLACLALVPLLRGQEDEREPTPDEVAVRAAVEDYVLAFYRAEPERLDRALSPEVKKMGYWRSAPDAPWSTAKHMNFEQAKALAATWNAEGQQGDDLTHEITLYEVCDRTACAKVTAHWGQDYFQLAKEDDGWRIHHVLWQSPPAPAKR